MIDPSELREAMKQSYSEDPDELSFRVDSITMRLQQIEAQREGEPGKREEERALFFRAAVFDHPGQPNLRVEARNPPSKWVDLRGEAHAVLAGRMRIVESAAVLIPFPDDGWSDEVLGAVESAPHVFVFCQEAVESSVVVERSMSLTGPWTAMSAPEYTLDVPNRTLTAESAPAGTWVRWSGTALGAWTVELAYGESGPIVVPGCTDKPSTPPRDLGLVPPNFASIASIGPLRSGASAILQGHIDNESRDRIGLPPAPIDRFRLWGLVTEDVSLGDPLYRIETGADSAPAFARARAESAPYMPAWGLASESAPAGSIVPVIRMGQLSNRDWSWDLAESAINLFVDKGGGLVQSQPESAISQIVARVVSPETAYAEVRPSIARWTTPNLARPLVVGADGEIREVQPGEQAPVFLRVLSITSFATRLSGPSAPTGTWATAGSIVFNRDLFTPVSLNWVSCVTGTRSGGDPPGFVVGSLRIVAREVNGGAITQLSIRNIVKGDDHDLHEALVTIPAGIGHILIEDQIRRDYSNADVTIDSSVLEVIE